MAAFTGRKPSAKDRGQRLSRANYYRSSNQGKKSPFAKKPPRKPGRFVSRLFNLLIISVIILCLGYSLVIRPQPRVIASSYPYRTAQVYEEAAQRKLSAIKNRTKLTFDEKSLVNDLQKQFPEISSVSVELPLFGQKPTLRLAIAAPSFTLMSKGSNYVISSDGIAIDSVQRFPSIKGLPALNDQSGFTFKVGQQVLSASEIDFVEQVLSQSLRAGVPVQSLTLPSKIQELDLRTKDRGYYVKFYLGGNAELQTGQFLAARDKFSREHIEPAEYLDVRVSGRIFYK